jgi:plasmid stabilization system protein ParE
MSLAIAFRAAARDEFAEAATWYEAQRAGLGARFSDEIARCVASAAQQPELYGVVSGEIRRVVARRFPYSLYFRREAERIVVLAVFHSSRDPRVWQRRR